MPARSSKSTRRRGSFRIRSTSGPGCSSARFCIETYEPKRRRMKVLLVDDHALIRDALRGVLKELVDVATVLKASDCRQAMRLVEEHPDLHLILLDLNLPDRDGFAVLADLRKRYATISLVVLSAFHDRENVVKALDLGALGFIPKSAPREVMVNALRLVLSGGIYIPPEALVRAEANEAQPVAGRPVSPADSGGAGLAVAAGAF